MKSEKTVDYRSPKAATRDAGVYSMGQCPEGAVGTYYVYIPGIYIRSIYRSIYIPGIYDRARSILIVRFSRWCALFLLDG